MSTTQGFKRWSKRAIELVVVVGGLTALSMYLGRNMLPAEAVVPELRLHELSVAPEPNSTTTTVKSIQWGAVDKTLVYFFAPWCSVCRVSMSGLSLLPENDAQIVAVALDWENTEQVSRFVNNVGFEGAVLLGTATTKAAFQIDAYPSYYVIDSKGQVLHRDRGFSTPPGLWLRLN